MPDLIIFKARSKLACCATCKHWTLGRKGESKNKPFCPIIGALRGNMQAMACSAYEQEQVEGQAVRLYLELLKEGAQ